MRSLIVFGALFGSAACFGQYAEIIKLTDLSRNGSLADKKYVEDAINALLSGRAVPLSKTKAVGCGIRWKDV